MRSLLFTLVLGLPLAPAAAQTAPAPTAKAEKMLQGKGSFEVKMAPTDHAPAPILASYSLDKSYHGDLEGTGKGEMLSAGDPKTGNAGYVAIEQITGRLNGKDGSFALMQSAIMATGIEPKMTVTIVPGSGTGELSGIYGSMTITIAGGKHSFTIDYAFAAK
jgi:hypothetical protein